MISKKIFKLFVGVMLVFICSACSLDAQITYDSKAVEEVITNQRTSPDYLSGETVVTVGGTAGYEVRAIFGEISEKTTDLSGNNWQVDGVFYE